MFQQMRVERKKMHRVFHGLEFGWPVPDFPLQVVPQKPKPDRTVYVAEKKIPAALCRYIIELFESDPNHYQGNFFTNAGELKVDVSKKKATELDLSSSQDVRWVQIEWQLLQAVTATIAEYEELHVALRHIGIFGDEGFRIKRYRNTDDGGVEFHNWHSDNGSVRNSVRVLAVLIYLNDVEKGGETVFYESGLAVKPKEGSIVVFPTGFTHAHGGAPPISGPKYVIANFLTF